MIDNNKVGLLLASALNEVTGKKFAFNRPFGPPEKTQEIPWSGEGDEVSVVRDVMLHLRNGLALRRHRYGLKVTGDGMSGTVILTELV